MTVGERVRRFRKKMGWSQERFAAAAGMPHRGHVALIESGARTPSLATLRKLAVAMGIKEWWKLCEETGRHARRRTDSARLPSTRNDASE